MLRRLGAILSLGLLAGACSNMVYSQRPLFDDRPVAALSFRPGLWAAPKKGCRFNSARPVAAWPKCANGDVFTAKGPADGALYGETSAVFANGDDLIVQSENKDRKASDQPDAANLPYSYMVLGDLRRDADGRITRFDEWFVQCGPPHRRHSRKVSKGAANGSSNATLHPFPGLVMKGENCEAADASAVRFAAEASRAFGASGARWMRDSDR
jgi:hypothetical protein